MPKKFGNANASKAFGEVGKEYAEKGNVITLVNIATENLIDHPDNGEDITMTSDLEASIAELGFIDPIEVTGRGMGEGKYMIVSGRRRRAAGVKTGMVVFPCLVRNFDNDSDVAKYVLYANQHRDSDSDPLLRARRYKLHEAQLKSEGFKGSKRKEIAKRMGLSVQMADRYAALSGIIEPVWNMISEEIIGISSVHKMASHSEQEQTEIYGMFNECLNAGHKLTRERVDGIIEAYRSGARCFDEAMSKEPVSVDSEASKIPEVRDSGLPLCGIMNTGPTETKEKKNDRSNEIRHEFDPIGAEHDKMDENKASWEETQSDNKKAKTADEKKEADTADAILVHVEKLDSFLSDIFTFKNADDAETAITSMGLLAVSMLNAMHSISLEYEKGESYKETLKKVAERIKILD